LLLASVTSTLTSNVRDHGLLAVFVLMAIDAVFPAASELVMVVGGAIAGWWIGLHGGRPLLERHGRWFHLSEEQLGRAERWFDRYEDWAVLVGRVTPVVRSFVSIPAGVFRVPFGRYVVLTAIGSAIWCFVLAGIGWALGSSYERFHHDFGFVEIAVVAGVLVLIAYLVLRRIRANRLERGASDPTR